MLKFIIVGLILTTVSSAPLESSTQPDKSNDTHTHTEQGLVRPSPINPDIPMDPKPAERIILDDTKSDRDRKSLNDESTSVVHEPQENLKSELSDTEPSSENNEEKKSDDKQNDEKKSSRIEYNHDEKRESNEASAPIKSTLKAETEATKIESSVKTGEPTIVYAVKADEKQRSESFQTSHRIPNVEEGERKFETSHHIPMHIDTERIKSVENAKVAEKQST